MLSKFLKEIEQKASDGKATEEERSYYMFLTYMVGALGDEAANALFTKAQEQSKYIALEHDADVLDGETYVVADEAPY